MKTLVGHPYLGECGWFFALWQSHLRYCAKRNDKAYMFVPEGWECFVEDFAEVMPIRVHGGKADRHYRIGDYEIEYLVKDSEKLLELEGAEHVLPEKKELQNPRIHHIYIRFGKANDALRTDIVVHPRNDPRDIVGGNRNWSAERWKELLGLLRKDGYLIACIGHPEAAHPTSAIVPKPLIGGMQMPVIDRQTSTFKWLANILASTRLVVGPSSGPMHLASMCGTPHLIWTDKNIWNLGMNRKGRNRQRYKSAWNPFGTRVWVIDDEGWQPEVETVYNAIKKAMEEL